MIKQFFAIIAFGLLTASCATPERPATSQLAPTADLARVWSDVPALMEQNKLTGLSVAVFDEYGDVQTRSFGVKRRGSVQPITDETAFSTASISKPATALLCLILDAEGVIDIDTPVASDLRRWQLPQSEFTGSATVTWRQLLTHTGGTSQHGFVDYYEGDTLPTIVDSLEGRIARYDGPISFLFEPGTSWKYSGGGYVILQMALEDRFGRPLHELVAERVFAPLGMTRTTMIQPGEPGFPSDAALVHDDAGSVIRTGLPITPQVAPSGMWSTPSDLATFAIAFQRALRGETVGPITPQIAREMTNIISLEYVGGMGMPFFRGMGFGNTDWFRHDGSNTGVNSDMLAAMHGGYGMVMMGNGDDNSAEPVFAELRREIIDAMGWKTRHPLDTASLDPVMREKIAGNYKGLLYDLGLDYRIENGPEGLRMVSVFFTQFLARESSAMHYLGNGEFAVEDYPNRLRFAFDADGEVESVTLYRPGSEASPYVKEIGNLR